MERIVFHRNLNLACTPLSICSVFLVQAGERIRLGRFDLTRFSLEKQLPVPFTVPAPATTT
jgi:hypothetical protein